MMAILFTNSASVKKGIDYLGVAQYGNAFQLTDETRVSINHTPFAKFPKYQSIFISPDFVYTFEEDTIVLLANEIQPDFGVITSVYSSLDVPLVADTESEAIISLTDRAGREVTKGTLAATCHVINQGNQNREITIRLYGDTVGLIGVAGVTQVLSNADRNIAHSADLSGHNLPADEIVSFTVEATGADCTVVGSVEPSHLRLERRNL